MTSNVGQPSISPGKLMHETVDHLSAIISIAQFYGMSEDLPSKAQADMKRLVQFAREVSNNLKLLAEILPEED
jgi:hypothetical protein